jgi:hypothetical protein
VSRKSEQEYSMIYVWRQNTVTRQQPAKWPSRFAAPVNEECDRIRVMTDEPRRLADLKLFGIDIVGAVALYATSQPVSKIVRYRCFGP